MNKNEKTALVPRLRFPEFVSTGEWKICMLNKLAMRINTRNQDNSIKRVLTNSAIDGVVDQSDYFDREVANQNNLENYFVIDEGDYVYNPRISATAPVGPISKNKVGKGVMSPLYTVFRFKNHNNDFYEQYFKTNLWHYYLKSVSNTGARHDRMSISNDSFMKMPLPYHTEKEQQKIADCLSSLDDLISAEDKKLESLKTHKKGLMQKLFPAEGDAMPEIRFEGYTDAWKQQKLGEVYKTYSGQTPLRSDASNFKNPTTPWIKTTDLNNGEIYYNGEDISEKGASALKVLPADTVLIAMYGGFNQIGRTGLLTYPATINQALTALEPNSKVNAYFLITQLNHRVDDWKTFAASSRKDANITKKDVESFNLRYPSLPEQITIGEFFRNLDELIMAQVKKIEVLRLHKKGLMQGLFPSIEEVGE